MIEPLASNQSSSRRMAVIWQNRYWIALALIYAWTVWQRFVLPLDPISDPDTWGYLSPALRKLTGREFGHTNSRNFVYPGFLFLLLRIFANFRVITLAQHFLGLLAGITFLLTWRRARILVSDSRISRISHDLLGLGGVAIFLLQWQTIVFEKEIRPEGICAFVLSITLYFLVQFVICFFLESRRIAAMAYAIALAFSAILLASVKPSFGFASLFVMTPITALFLRKGWSWQKIGFSLGFAFSAAVILLPEHFLSRNDEMSRTFLPTMLFVVHADLIRDQLASDLQNNVSLPYSRDRLEHLYLALDSEIAKSHAAWPKSYRSLGFNPDFLMFDPNSIVVQTRREFGGDANASCAFYRFYYWRIWQKEPGRVLGKIARQLLMFYWPYCRAYDFSITQKFGDRYRLSFTSFNDPICRNVWTAYSPAVEYMKRTEELAQRGKLRFQQFLIVPVVFLIAICYSTWLVVALVLAVIVATHLHRWRRMRFLGTMVVFAFLFNAACCLEVAVINSLETRRYSTVQMYSTLFAQLLGLWFILEFVVQMLEPRRENALPLK